MTYDEDYKSVPCFWETKPGSFVRELATLTSVDGKQILDVGAGEGGNAVYLASLGASVHAIDVSAVSLTRFFMQPDYDRCRQRITVEAMDFRALQLAPESYDVVVAYGVLHCLPSCEDIRREIVRIRRWVRPGGYVVIATFNDLLPPPPAVQSYLRRESFLAPGELLSLFSDWTVLRSSEGVIRETHPNSTVEHEHSISRIVAQRSLRPQRPPRTE